MKKIIVSMVLISILAISQFMIVTANDNGMLIELKNGENVESESELELDKVVVVSDIDIEGSRVKETFETSKGLQEIGKVLYLRGLKLGDMTCKLYPEFENPDKAFDNITNSSHNAIKYLEEKYQLEKFSKDTIDKYQGYTLSETEKLDDNDTSVTSELLLLDEFFNMYENTCLNNEILEVVEGVNGNFLDMSIAEAATVISDLKIMVPFNTGVSDALENIKDEIVIDIEKEYNISSEDLEKNYQNQKQEYSTNMSQMIEPMSYSGNSKFNIDKGITYATTYATKRNKNYRSFDGGDCTNFVSQIKKAGGVKPYYAYVGSGNNVRIDSNTSWYYSGAYNYGKIWTVADKFAKFFGVKSTTTNFTTFSSNVKKGSFIAYSRYGDGKWNHMAFVTAKSSTKKTSNGVSFYDFKVAQHTDDYHQWVSHKKNNWETLKKSFPKVKFAIVN